MFMVSAKFGSSDQLRVLREFKGKKILRTANITVVFALIWGLALPASASQAVTAGYRDFSYSSTGNVTPTGNKTESKLWWNDNAWWGSLWSPQSNSFHIFRLDGSSKDWVDTG